MQTKMSEELNKHKLYRFFLEKAIELSNKIPDLDRHLILKARYELIEEVEKEWVSYLDSLSITQVHRKKRSGEFWKEKNKQEPAIDKNHITIKDPFVEVFELVDHEYHALKIHKELALKIFTLNFIP